MLLIPNLQGYLNNTLLGGLTDWLLHYPATLPSIRLGFQPGKARLSCQRYTSREIPRKL
jgi:hypothetical protein